MHPISETANIHITSDSFQLQWDNNGSALLVPSAFAAVLPQLGIGSAEQLASALVAFPSAFSGIGVAHTHLLSAIDEAKLVLAQRLDQRLVQTGAQTGTFSPKFGAKKP